MSRYGSTSTRLRFSRRSLTPSWAERGWWFDEAMAAETSVPGLPQEPPARTDVCIVGGGFTGLWTALELKRRSPGTDVTLLEADVCGGGASGRNGGFAMTWWSKFPSLQKLCGTEMALWLARRAEAAVAEIGRFCHEHGIEADFLPCGWLWTATNLAQVDAWQATLSALERAGVDPFESLSREEVARRSGSPVHLAGVFEPTVATVQPARLARGLTRVARQAGVRIHERTPMLELSGPDPVRVRTPSGEVRAQVAVLALNAWASRIPQVGRGLVVVSSDIVATAPMSEPLEAIGWRNGPAISDSRRLVNYYRTSSDGRVVFGKGGGTISYTGHLGAAFHRPSPRVQEVASQFRLVYPMLWRAEIQRAWRGPIDYSITGLPFLCRWEGSRHVLIAAGFSGNGVGPSKLVGELLAQMALDGDDAGVPPGLAAAPTTALPPEPARYLGARVVRRAVARKEAAEDLGRPGDTVSRLLASLDPTGFVDRGEAPSGRSGAKPVG